MNFTANIVAPGRMVTARIKGSTDRAHRVLIDADGNVFRADASGNAFTIPVGRVGRHAVNRNFWVADPGADQGVLTDHHSRDDALRRLLGLDWGRSF